MERVVGLAHRVLRRLHATVRERVTEGPVVVVTGPRSVGKSTLLGGLGADLGVDVLDLDDLDVRSAVSADPML